MKDFKEILQNKNQPNQLLNLTQTKSLQSNNVSSKKLLENIKDKLIKICSPLVLSIVTGPFTTISILLQVTSKPLYDSISIKSKGQSKQMLQLIKSGLLGDNRIYQSPSIKNYHDGFTKLARQGLRGMYKGNFTNYLIMGANTKLRTKLYQLIQSKYQSQTYLKNALTIIICTISDLCTLPLLMCQSRLVLQNSRTNFRTYFHFTDILAKTSPKIWFTGSSLLFVKNILFTFSWLRLIKQSPVNSFILSSILSHLVTYPCLTIIRNLQCNASNIPMMHQRQQNIRQCTSRIYRQFGFLGFYRGFGAYTIVHIFLGMIMLDMNIRSGYFSMIE